MACRSLAQGPGPASVSTGARAVAIGALLAATAACPRARGPAEPQTPDDEGEPLALQCPQYICGQNDPRLNDYRFSALNLDGKVDEVTGSQYLFFTDPAGTRLRLEVTLRGELYGVYPDGRKLEDQALVGSQIHVRIRGKNGRPLPRVISIKGITHAERLSNEPGGLRRYWLAYGPPTDPQRMPLCYGEDKADLGALLSRDELYDRLGREVSVPYGDAKARGWVNFLCRDHALEKMKRMSYEPGRSPDDPYYTTVAERNAAIKMITAAYCVNREGQTAAFTRPGTDVFWQNDKGWIVDGAPPSTSLLPYELEAYWDENGAMCLSSRRAEDTRGDEISHCWSRLPRCETAPARWKWRTYVPVPAQ